MVAHNHLKGDLLVSRHPCKHNTVYGINKFLFKKKKKLYFVEQMTQAVFGARALRKALLSPTHEAARKEVRRQTVGPWKPLHFIYVMF